jgi:predicted dehydrogenase/threonine dehydrogenase-like Zn-dependent dehydrogenase
MKQVVQYVKTGQTAVIDVPRPQAHPGTAVVQNAASLVSTGTERMLVDFAGKSMLGKARSRPDLVRQVIDKARREGLLTTIEAVQNRLEQPLPLGYASAGRIVALGDGMEGFKVGQRVACAGGGYAVHAEYVSVPRNLLAPLPDNVDYESGAFATLGAIALHGFRLTELQVGSRLAVIGMGLLGLLASMLARAAGCTVLGIDVDPERVELARSLGFSAVVRGEAEEAGSEFTNGMGFDGVQICADTASDDTVVLAGELARNRAVVVSTGVVGLDLPRKPYFEKELTFLVSRSYGPGRYDPLYEEAGIDYPPGYVRWTEGRNLQAFVDLVGSGRIDIQPLISHRYPIQQAVTAYEMITAGQEPFLGVVMTYDVEADADQALRRVPFKSRPVAKEAVIKLGASGAGNFATAVMFPALKKTPGVELVGVVSGAGLKSAQSGRRFGFRYAAAEFDDLLQDDDINTVAIFTRHNLHAPQTLAALEAGKHVFCEKPLALHQTQLEALARALRDSDRLLMVGFNRRFAPMAKTLKRHFRPVNEPLAMHYKVNAGYLPPTHWLHDEEEGGGRIIGEGCHFIDFLTYICDSVPVRVRTFGLPDGGRYREDNVVIHLTFANGSIGTVEYLANGDKAFPKERVEIFGGGRVGVLDDYRRLELVADGRRRVQRSRLRQDKGHRAEWAAMVDTLRSAGDPPIPYDHLFSVTAATFAAVESLRCQETINLEALDLG